MSVMIPNSVLFCCDHNAIRSPMAEGLAKLYYGKKFFIQSAGIVNPKLWNDPTQPKKGKRNKK